VVPSWAYFQSNPSSFDSFSSCLSCTTLRRRNSTGLAELWGGWPIEQILEILRYHWWCFSNECGLRKVLRCAARKTTLISRSSFDHEFPSRLVRQRPLSSALLLGGVLGRRVRERSGSSAMHGQVSIPRRVLFVSVFLEQKLTSAVRFRTTKEETRFENVSHTCILVRSWDRRSSLPIFHWHEGRWQTGWRGGDVQKDK